MPHDGCRNIHKHHMIYISVMPLALASGDTIKELPHDYFFA